MFSYGMTSLDEADYALGREAVVNDTVAENRMERCTTGEAAPTLPTWR